MAVNLNVRGAEISQGADPSPLFQTGFLDSTHAAGYSHAYAVSADGQRFLLPQVDNIQSGSALRGRGGIPPEVLRTQATDYADRHAAQSSSVGSTAPINVVLNWTSTLKK